MKYTQDKAIEIVSKKMRAGEITVDQANVMKIKLQGFSTIVNSLPRQVRTALNKAVRARELGHFKKEGHKPEMYYNPDFEDEAIAERQRIEERALSVLPKIIANYG